ncbi:MAG: hypothetical protein RMK57_08545 [Bryobacterales bacterium]|nr:hypothetical protein [Bryobacteraceae bacterium]MDW8354564.1 hypothetical protein [Bryobacterales bacterium]
MALVLQGGGSDPQCHFCAPAGAQVTLRVQGTAGVVRFASARYDGQELVPGAPVEEIRFVVKPGPKVLTAVYAFSLGARGRGQLCERGSEGELQVLEDDLRGDNEVRGHRICGV